MGSEGRPAGWYPDPDDASQHRYWDGTDWTPHRVPASSRAGQEQAWSPEPPSPPQPQPAPADPAHAAGGPRRGPDGSHYVYAASELPSNVTLALVLGILSLALCGAITGIPAIIVGRKAMREIDASGGRLHGRGIALTGVLLGAAGTIVFVLAFAFFAVLAVLAISSA